MNRNEVGDVILKQLVPEMGNTIWMLIVTTLISLIFSFMLAIGLYYVSKNGLRPIRSVFLILESITDAIISMPFMILAVTLIPLTRLIVGTNLGKVAALVPLTFVTSVVIGKYIYDSMLEVSPISIKAARSFGASDFQIIKIILREAIPMIISGISISTVITLGSIAVMGALGAGGIGYVAITYGYRRNQTVIVVISIVVLVIFTQLIHSIGEKLSKRWR